MASSPGLLLLVSIALGVRTVSAVNIVAADIDGKGAGMIRRESTQVHLDPSGEIHQVIRESEGSTDIQKESNPTDCDHQFLLMAEGAANCSGSGKPFDILSEAQCTQASLALKLEKAATNFTLNTHEVNPLPYPRGCFLNTSTNTVSFNPEESHPNGTIIGRKICMRTKYIDGKNDTDPSTGCTGDAKPVLIYDDCVKAVLCDAGGEACRLQSFRENMTHYKKDDQPRGCFKDIHGCWGFNHLETVPTGSITGTPVCLNVVPPADAAPGGGKKAPAA